MTTVKKLIALGSILGSCVLGRGGIVFQKRVGNTWQDVSTNDYVLDDNATPTGIYFTLAHHPSLGTFRIYEDSGADIGEIDLSLMETIVPGGTFELLIGSGATTGFDPSQALPSPGCANLGSISSDPAQHTKVQIYITGNLVSGITARQLVRADIGGDVLQKINIKAAAGDPVSATIIAHSFARLGSVQSAGARIVRVEANGTQPGHRDLDGDVINTNGPIDTVQCRHGEIGSNPNTADYPQIKAQNASTGVIGAVLADEGPIRAYITADAGIQRLSSGHPTFGMKGTLTAPRLLDQGPTLGGEILTRGYFRMTTVFSEGIPPKGRVLVGRLGRTADSNNTSDFGTTMMTLGNGSASSIGLQGRIIIDAFNDPPPAVNGNPTAWCANVVINTPANLLKLGPGANCGVEESCTEDFTNWQGEIAQTSTALGGGIIALNRYRVHGADSSVNVSNSDNSVTSTTEAYPGDRFTIRRRLSTCPITVVMKYYGPVQTLFGVTAAVRVSKQACGGSETPVDQGTVPTPTITDRAVSITFPGNWFDMDTTYTFSGDVSNAALQCNLGTGVTPPPVSLDNYKFVVDPCTPGDINNDGVTNTVDLTLLLVHFGQSGYACVSEGNLNRAGIVDTADLTILLSGFGQTCQTCQTEEMLARSNGRGAGASASGLGFAAGAGTAPAPGQGSTLLTQTAASTPPGPVLAALDFTSAEAYQAWVSTLNDEEFINHIKHVLEVIHALGLD